MNRDEARGGGFDGEVWQVERSYSFFVHTENDGDCWTGKMVAEGKMSAIYPLCFLFTCLTRTISSHLPQPHCREPRVAQTHWKGSSWPRGPPICMLHSGPQGGVKGNGMGLDLRHGCTSHQIDKEKKGWASGYHDSSDNERDQPGDGVEASDNDGGGMQRMLRRWLRAIDGLPFACRLQVQDRVQEPKDRLLGGAVSD